MIAGRGISGIGIACILSLASKFITPYFKGKSLAFILSLNLSIGKKKKKNLFLTELYKNQNKCCIWWKLLNYLNF